jgi:hypothetical protein
MEIKENVAYWCGELVGGISGFLEWRGELLKLLMMGMVFEF